MSRRHRAEKRTINPDPLYNDLVIEKFINMVMVSGKKSLSRKIVYKALENFSQKVNVENPKDAFEQALENAKPSLEVKSRRIGGATYQVPIEIAQERKVALALRWIIANARSKSGRSMTDALTIELADCFNNQGITIKKKDDMHKMAEANKAFAHYKW